MNWRNLLPFFFKTPDVGTETPPTTEQHSIVSPQTGQELSPKEVMSALPTQGGRSSVPQAGNVLATILSELDTLNPDYPMEYVTVLERLATYNEDVGYAVDNIVQLAATKHNIYFGEDVSEIEKVRMLAELTAFKKRMYRGGSDSLINDLLSQITISGALSAESVVSNSLDSVQHVVLVKPQSIVFRFDKTIGDYVPYQKSSVNYNGQATIAGDIKLNTITYKYESYRRWNDSPYAIPPFLTVLESIKIDHEMMCGFKNMLKKLGIFGFLEVMVNRPAQIQGESDDVYWTRLKNYLATFIEPEMKKGLENGMVIGFTGASSFKLNETTSNVAGVSQLFEMMTVRRHAGLKQDPSMMGRNFSTTETMARVLIAKLSNQVRNYQKMVETFLEECYTLHLTLKGFKNVSIEVEFDAPMIGDALKDEQAYKQKIENAITLYKQGIIDQTEVAQIAGYDEPAEPEPLSDPLVDAKLKGLAVSDKTQPSKGTEPNSVQGWINELHGDDEDIFSPEHTGNCGCTACSTGVESLSSLRDEMDEFVGRYFGEVKTTYTKAVNKVVGLVGQELETLGAAATVDQINDKILTVIYSNWGSAFLNRNTSIIKKWVRNIYTSFRKNKSLLSNLKDAPEPFLDVEDFRTIDFFKNVDDYYMGKFIASPATRKAVYDFVVEQNIKNGIPIGTNRESLAAFKTKFANVLNLQDYQIKRIVDTTTNSLRNIAAVNYMNQAEVQEYQILEVNDRLTCPWCREMNGKTFSVEMSMSNVRELIVSEPDMLPSLKPFATAMFKDPKDIAPLTGRELQNKGVFMPPQHPACRGTIAAIL